VGIEKGIEKGIISLLEMMGAWVFKVHGHLGQRAGVPDILACLNGRFIGIEVKAPEREIVVVRRGKAGRRKLRGGKLSEKQAVELEAIRRAGGVAIVAWGVEDAIRKLEESGIKTPFRSIHASKE